ncbi:MAG: hypothetical protein CVU50_06940 [Candidatus Cloacimonetes bacterium HGW-Cloacimonetes-3]|nr:MAG: hypothetical protein CVU50_06940 [Candidatus Cloacimonetes bacterium HGW-Cloacimonetes-3]
MIEVCSQERSKKGWSSIRRRKLYAIYLTDLADWTSTAQWYLEVQSARNMFINAKIGEAL